MKLVVATWGNLSEWSEALRRTPERPRLPYPYAMGAAFAREGHTVIALDLHGRNKERRVPPFSAVYRREHAPEAISDSDGALMTLGDLRSIGRTQARIWALRRRTILFSFVWNVRPLPLREWPLGIATRLVTRRARGIVFLTAEQCAAAKRELPPAVFVERMTWGIDTAFYRQPVRTSDVPEAARELVARLLTAPFVILAGDQLRQDGDTLGLASRGVRIARVPQSPISAGWLRSEARRRGLEDRVFVFEKATYPLLRFLMRHARAHVGLVDASWQPAGWTVACESLATGLPVLIYEGLVSRELKRLGASAFVTALRPGALAEVHAAIDALPGRPEAAFAHRVAEFARTNLDMEIVGTDFARRVASHFRSQSEEAGHGSTETPLSGQV